MKIVKVVVIYYSINLVQYSLIQKNITVDNNESDLVCHVAQH